MKKVLLLLLAVLLLGSLAACDVVDSLPFPGGTTGEISGPVGIAEPPAGLADLDFTIVTDLPEISLIYHDLDDSNLLESIMFRSFLGADIAPVTIISEYDELVHDNAYILNDAWAIELHYFARRHETAVQSVILSFEGDRDTEWIFPDSHLTMRDVRATEDHQMAFLAVTEELTNGAVRILLYIAQNVPGTNDVVILDVVLFPHLWEAHDDVVLHELSRHIGLDLRTYLTEFLLPGAAEEI